MLSDLLNDCEAATNSRVLIGVPLREEEYLPHCFNYENCPESICIGAFGVNPNAATNAIYWLEENSLKYGYRFVGSYVDAAILVPATE